MFEKRRITQLLLATCMLIALFVPAYARIETGAAVNTTQTRLDRSDVDGLVFTLRTADFDIEPDGRITLDNLTHVTREAGAPALPYYAAYIAVPPEASVAVAIETSGITTRKVATVRPAPQPDPDAINPASDLSLLATAQSAEELLPLVFTPDTAVYSRDALYPDVAYSLSAPLYYRDMRLVELRLYPLRYNPARQTMQQAATMHVSVTFSGARLDALHPAPSADAAYERALADTVLNFAQAEAWRSLPQDVVNAVETSLPIGVATYKIEINQDGIYDITGAALAAAGMNLTNVDPNTIQMLHRGETVAFQFIDQNGNGRFDPNDKIRFYGWAFEGPRSEKQFVNNNVFWLWAGGSAAAINTRANLAGGGYPLVESFQETITKEPENYFFSTWTNRWDEFPNEPDSFYWDFIRQVAPNPVTKTYTIDLPDPIDSAFEGAYLAEFMTRENSLAGTTGTYTVTTRLNEVPTLGELSWRGRRNVNAVGAMVNSDLVQPGAPGYPANEVTVSLNSRNIVVADIYLNRITVTYERALLARNNQLIFGDVNGGQNEFQISGFTTNVPANALVWDITNPKQPEQVQMRADNISGSGPYTFQVGSNHAAGARFIATTANATLTAVSISRYTPTNINPPGGADWIAISHNNFLPAAVALANHRANLGLTTYVVNINDIVNQYGYGFHLPGAIRSYLQYALGAWATPPSYVTIFGDATINPRNLDCPTSGPGACSLWDKDEPTYVVTDLAFVDRFAGLVPSDHPMALLSGDDLLPDIGIARIPAQTQAEANAVVQKIITYEGQRMTDPQPWHDAILMVADDADGGGNFCRENELVAEAIPAEVDLTQLCLPEPTTAATDALRAAMGQYVNDQGISTLNFRGHGSFTAWADTSGAPPLLSIGQSDFWLNGGRPVIILSADCLDGYFAWPNRPALGETFLKALNNRGSVAHWSSAGLGFTFEHTILNRAYYAGVYEQELLAIGDAVNYAKVQYHLSGSDDSEMYGFILLGDPAMQVYVQPEEVKSLYLPIIVRQ